MDTSVQEFDGATQTWITSPEAEPVAETPVAEPTEGDDPSAAAPVEAPVEVKANPRKDPKARVEAATAKEAAAKRERDEAKAESQKLQARIAELEARTAPEPVKRPIVATDAEPTVDQFDSYEQFVKAQARWEARQEISEQDKARQKQAVVERHEQGQREIERQFGERYRTALQTDPDFVESVNPVLLNTPRVGVLKEGQAATYDNFLVEQVFRSPHPKEMLLHLSDPGTYQRLATLHPIEVLGELAMFNKSQGAASPAASVSQAPPVSHAKSPIRPVGSSPQLSSEEPSEQDSDDDWLRKENARIRRRGRG